ncbi:TetR/AcrR family transcriptional regulator [Aureivirga marina]|uniref:TetR/AcrR family transcriptional regulator n=1 Tax=Aureivirga marina TaxID=1182451 RepID=UPI0018CB112D|nr:TetR/AcrR family transcriptional regulator [Aureivirga marina]
MGKKQSVKERIIKTASDLFYKQGYTNTGINQIIKEAEVAKASMYQHFRSKEEIAVAFLQYRHLFWMENMIQFVGEEEKDVKQKLAKIFDFLKSWLEEMNYIGCAFQNIVTNLKPEENSIKEEVIFHKSFLENWILKELENSPYKIISEELSKEIMILIEGAIILSQIHGNSSPIENAKKAYYKVLK